ncbi:MAG: sulfatase-like hydrolase/transferase [Spirochaetia bacterium]
MKKPNIVFILTDDQRFNTIGALGNPEIKTPVLDSLVSRGMSFTQAHIPGGSVGAVCMPSRAMIHTGRTLFHLEDAGASVPGGHALLGETLRGAGYYTWGSGKWHNGREAYARSFSGGDEIFFGGMADHWNVPAYRFDPSGKYSSRIPYIADFFYSREVEYREADHINAGKHSTDSITDSGVSFLNEYSGEEPWFTYFSFLAPHDPRTMPEKFRDMYDPESISLPENFAGGHPFDTGALKIRDEVLASFPRTEKEIKQHLAEYYAMISHLDHSIGRIIDAVKERGELDNTLFIVTGDNGLALGSHGLMGKQSLYDHSVRIPLIMAGPGVPEGAASDVYLYLLDIFPTLCDYLEIPVPGTVEGESFLPVMKGEKETAREYLFGAYAEFMRSVKRGSCKLIEYAVGDERQTQLFDLESDPAELVNLSADPSYRDELNGLRELLIREARNWDDRQSEWGRKFWDKVTFTE